MLCVRLLRPIMWVFVHTAISWGAVSSLTLFVLLVFNCTLGLSCGRPSDRPSFVFPLHHPSTSPSYNFAQHSFLLHLTLSPLLPSASRLTHPTGTKVWWTTLNPSSAPSSSGQTNPPSSSLATSHHKRTKHTVSQGQTTGTTSSRNSRTSHTSPSNLPSSLATCAIPSLSRSTWSIPSSPAR